MGTLSRFQHRGRDLQMRNDLTRIASSPKGRLNRKERNLSLTPRDRSVAKHLATLIEAPIDFVMEQRMLRTIKRLAESRRPHR